MRIRPTLACVVALALASTTISASAATRKPPKPPKPVCNQLTDVSGDGQSDLVPVVKTKPLDIVGGDIATGPTTMVAVLRLASTDMSAAADPFANTGYGWWISAQSSLGQLYGFRASRSGAGIIRGTASVDGVGVVTTFAVVGNTFVWTIKRSVAPNLSRPKNVFSQLSAQSEYLSSSADTAGISTAKYTDKAPHCVVAK